jgi:acid phosphatase family membrane protein YuiD
MTGALAGFDSVEFAMCAVFASVVMYDATGVRRETGLQAQVINEILRQVFINGKPIADDDLKELVGHKPLEVLAGAILGLITAGAYILL